MRNLFKILASLDDRESDFTLGERVVYGIFIPIAFVMVALFAPYLIDWIMYILNL